MAAMQIEDEDPEPEIETLHAKVVQKTANIIDSMQSMDICSLYWIEQHVKECKNDYIAKKEYVKYVKTSVRMF